MNRSELAETGNIRDINNENFLEEDNVEVFYTSSQLLDENNLPSAYLTNTDTRNQVNTAIDNIVHFDINKVSDKVKIILELLSKVNKDDIDEKTDKELVDKINELKEFQLEQLQTISNHISVLNYIMITSGRNSKLTQDLRLKQ